MLHKWHTEKARRQLLLSPQWRKSLPGATSCYLRSGWNSRSLIKLSGSLLYRAALRWDRWLCAPSGTAVGNCVEKMQRHPLPKGATKFLCCGVSSVGLNIHMQTAASVGKEVEFHRASEWDDSHSHNLCFHVCLQRHSRHTDDATLGCWRYSCQKTWCNWFSMEPGLQSTLGQQANGKR